MSKGSFELYFAWLIACLALLGSLYFSEVQELQPCYLCWFERVCIYPLAIILGMALYRNFFAIIPYALPLAITGLIFAGYQVAIQEIPGWEPIDVCGAGPSCSSKTFIGLGPITLPMLSLGAFVLMTYLLIRAYRKSKQQVA